MMKRLYFDTNVMLDFLAMRELFWVPMAKTVSFCDIIITRNGTDFKKSSLPFLNGDEFLKSLDRSF